MGCQIEAAGVNQGGLPASDNNSLNPKYFKTDIIQRLLDIPKSKSIQTVIDPVIPGDLSVLHNIQNVKPIPSDALNPRSSEKYRWRFK